MLIVTSLLQLSCKLWSPCYATSWICSNAFVSRLDFFQYWSLLKCLLQADGSWCDSWLQFTVRNTAAYINLLVVKRCSSWCDVTQVVTSQVLSGKSSRASRAHAILLEAAMTQLSCAWIRHFLRTSAPILMIGLLFINRCSTRTFMPRAWFFCRRYTLN